MQDTTWNTSLKTAKEWKWITEKKIMTITWLTRIWRRTRRSSPPTPPSTSTFYISLHIHPAAGRRDPNLFTLLMPLLAEHIGSTPTESVNWYPGEMFKKSWGESFWFSSTFQRLHTLWIRPLRFLKFLQKNILKIFLLCLFFKSLANICPNAWPALCAVAPPKVCTVES